MPKRDCLNLNGSAPLRVQPQGLWGPQRVATVAERKRLRRRVIFVTVSLAITVFAIGYSFYRMLMG